MKKDFLDKMYELRSSIWIDINLLVGKRKLPTDGNCEGCGNETEAELRTRRSQIGSLNKLIEDYLEIHGGVGK